MSNYDLILMGAIAGAIITTLVLSMQTKKLMRNAYNRGYQAGTSNVHPIEKLFNIEMLKGSATALMIVRNEKIVINKNMLINLITLYSDRFHVKVDVLKEIVMAEEREYEEERRGISSDCKQGQKTKGEEDNEM